MRRLTHNLPSALVVLTMCVALASALVARPAYAAAIVVNTNADNTTTDGLCSLREAIANANADAATYPDCTAGSGADTITFAGSYTITLSSALPDITTDMTITGNGTANTIIQASASAGTATYRIVKINKPGATAPNATLEYITMRNGVEASGGAINVASSNLTLNYVSLTDNQVNNVVSTGLNGGAISINSGTLTINNSTLSSNSVTTSDTSTNIRGSGGAIFAGGGTVTLNNTTISGNSAIRGGGGLYANGGTMNINYSTIANNTSNNADGTTAYSSLDGGGINRNAGTINLKSSIVAGNKKGVSSATNNDCNGTITSQDYNLTGSGTGCSLTGTGNVTVTPSSVFTSVLGPLANNGGSTYTHLLYGGNAAQDAIPNGTNSCGSGTFTQDQRGSTRPYNSSCDIGAYESQDAVPTVALSSAASNPTNTSPIPVTVTFSEDVTGFTSGDITAGNATVSNFAGSGASYSFDLTPTSDGTVTADIAAGAAQDSALNNSTAASQLSRAYDETPPAAPVVSSPASSSSTNDTTPSVSGTAEVSSTVAIYFDDALSGSTTADASGNWTYTPSAELSANATHKVKAKATDAAGNTGVDSNTNTFTIDTTVPTVLGISRFSPVGTTTNASSVDFFVGFSEGSLTGVGSSDFALTTTGSISGASISSVTYSNGASVTVTVNTGSGNGTIRLDLSDDDTIADAAGNMLGGTGAGNGSFTAGQAYTIDKTAPTVSMSSTASSLTNSSPIPVTVTFSESVSGFTSGDITAGNASVRNFTGSGASYSFDLVPSGDGTVTADIAAGVAQDSVGNDNTAATQLSRSYDGTAPTVTAFTTPALSKSLSVPITAFSASDAISVMGYLITTSATPPTASDSGWASAAPSSYTVGVNGSYTLYPWAKDAAGHVSAAYGAPAGVTVDTTAPMASSLAAANVATGGGASYTFTVSFSDNLAIDGASLGAGDIRVTGPGGFSQLATLVSVTPGGSGTPRTATYQVSAPGGAWDTADSGSYTIAVEANQVFDTAGNAVAAVTLGGFQVRLGYTAYIPLAQR